MREYTYFLKASLKSPVVRGMFITSLLFLIFLPYYIAFFLVDYRSLSIFKTYFSFPLVFNSLGIFQYYPSLLFGAVIVLILTKAFEDGTFKILLINGYTIRKLWINTLLYCLIISVLLFFITTIITFHIGYLKTESFVDIHFVDFEWILIYFFQTFMLLLFAVTLSFLIKHSGAAVFVYLIYFFLVERTIAYFFDMTLKAYPVFRFLPGKVVEDLTYMQPNPRFVIQYLEYQNERWVASFFWLVFMLIFSFFLFKKANYRGR